MFRRGNLVFPAWKARRAVERDRRDVTPGSGSAGHAEAVSRSCLRARPGGPLARRVLRTRPSWEALGAQLPGQSQITLLFIPVYRQIRETDAEAWVAYFLAFQNGFFWEAALSAVVMQFTA